MSLRRLSAREIQRRPGRAALTLLSIVIGVAAVVSVSIATTTTRRAYQEMSEQLTGRAALEVVAEGSESFDEEDLVAALEKVPGVQAVAPTIQRPTIMHFHGERAKLLVLGIDPQRDRRVRDYEIAEGQFFDHGSGVLLEESFAKNNGIKLHDRVKLNTHLKLGLLEVPVVGLLTMKGPAAFRQGGMLVMPLRTAQKLFKAKEKVDSIHVVVDPAADLHKVQVAISEELPEDLVIRKPAARTQLADETLRSSAVGLRFASALSMLMAGFIILNTFLINVGERRRQLCILRAIGATRRQIAWLLIGEGVALGAVGTLLGMVAGLGGAYVLTRSMERLFQMPLPSIHVSWPPFLWAGLFGLVISLAGTYLPARKASRLSPLEGMGSVAPEDKSRVKLSVTLTGLATVLVSCALLAASLVGWLPIGIAVYVAAAALVGMVMLIPPALGPLSSVFAKILAPLLRVEGRLAHLQLLRRRTRTALTVGVLFVATAAGIGMANSILENVDDVRTWTRRTIVGDFFVRAMMPDMTTGAAIDVPPQVGTEIKAIPGIENVERVRWVNGRAEDRQVVVLAMEFSYGGRLHMDIKDGDPAEIRQRLAAGDVVVGSVLAQRAGLKRNGQISIETPDGPRKLTIAGITNEYAFGGLAVYIQRDTAKRVLGIDGVNTYIVLADHAQLPAVETALREICRKNGLLLQSYTEISTNIDRMMGGIVGGLWVILALAIVVAAFGISNTLSIHVLEQTRELGLLRIVAMTRGQVRKMILSQAALIGCLGLVPGIAVGVGMAYFIHICMLPTTGHVIDFSLHPGLLVSCFAVALGVVLLAAWVPAQRAARVELLEALRYE